MERADNPRTRKRLAGEPWEIARLALYLASDEADHVTGQSFTIDGGLEPNWGSWCVTSVSNMQTHERPKHPTV